MFRQYEKHTLTKRILLIEQTEQDTSVSENHLITVHILEETNY